MEKIRWAILGPGNIARKFARAVQQSQDAELYAVASHSMQRARDFADAYQIPHAYDSYDALLADDRVQAVYIATLNNTHAQLAVKCAAAHKAVLCEKPAALTEQEAIAMKEASEKYGVLIMEAMWTAFLPATSVVRNWMQSGEIGRVRNLSLAFSFNNPYTKPRIYKKELGGGGLPDVGVYCISYAMQVLGQAPLECKAMAQIGPTGVDEFMVLLMRFPGDVLVDCHIGVALTCEANGIIYGEKGRIRVGHFWVQNKCDLCDDEGNIKEQFVGDQGNGFRFELAHFNRLLREGRLQSDIMPLEFTRTCASVFDTVRKDVGL